MRYATVASEILPSWEISLAFVSPTVAQRLYKKWRGKTYTPNVLAYEVGKYSGEVIICKEVAKSEAKSYGHTESEHLLYLFIHALLHLKGMAHGSTMERRENMLLTRYGALARVPHGSKNRNRNRHRYLSGKDRRRRRDRG